MLPIFFLHFIYLIATCIAYQTTKKPMQTNPQLRVEKIANVVQKPLEDIKPQDLEDFDTVYHFSEGHSLIHRSNLDNKPNEPKHKIIGTSSNEWLELKYGKLQTIYGEVIAYNIISPSNSDGSLGISRSQSIGVTFDYNTPSQTTKFLMFLEFSEAYTFEISSSISMSASASCKVPAGSFGGLYMFEPTDIYEVQTRSWKKKSSFKKKIKSLYSPSKWTKKVKSVVRTFKNTNFVCTNDEEYISQITPRIEQSRNGKLIDFTEFNR